MRAIAGAQDSGECNARGKTQQSTAILTKITRHLTAKHTLYLISCHKGKGKGKAVPLQAWTGPEGSTKLTLPDFVTTAQDGGKAVSLTHRPPLPPGNAPATHFC